MLDYIRSHVPDRRKAPLCGNSIATDRAFLARDMPALNDWLHYRMVDVSSVKELARRWYPRAYFAAPEKHGGHRALADIKESVLELRYYREAIFVAQPGPSSDQAREIAAQIGGVPGSGHPSRLSLTVPARLPRDLTRLGRRPVHRAMVGVAQLVEHRVVVPRAAGSSPVTHPIRLQGSGGRRPRTLARPLG